MTDKPEQPPIGRTKGAVERQVDELAREYEKAAFDLVPRAFFPFFAVFFVVLCGIMAVMLFAVGSIFGGLLFSFVVLVGLYVGYNKFVLWRDARAERDATGSDQPTDILPPTVDDLWTGRHHGGIRTGGVMAMALVVLVGLPVGGPIAVEYFGMVGFSGLLAVAGLALIVWRIWPILRTRTDREKR